MDEAELSQVLASLDPTTRTLVAEVDLGQQALEFLPTELGQHLVGCLHQEIFLAQAALADVSFWRWRHILQLQNRIWRAQFLLSWLRDLISSGASAEATLKEAEHER